MYGQLGDNFDQSKLKVKPKYLKVTPRCPKLTWKWLQVDLMVLENHLNLLGKWMFFEKGTNCIQSNPQMLCNAFFWVQNNPRWPPGDPQRTPKWPQVAAKCPPSDPQASTSHSRALQRTPKWPQVAAKCPPSDLQASTSDPKVTQPAAVN